MVATICFCVSVICRRILTYASLKCDYLEQILNGEPCSIYDAHKHLARRASTLNSVQSTLQELVLTQRTLCINNLLQILQNNMKKVIDGINQASKPASNPSNPQFLESDREWKSSSLSLGAGPYFIASACVHAATAIILYRPPSLQSPFFSGPSYIEKFLDGIVCSAIPSKLASFSYVRIALHSPCSGAPSTSLTEEEFIETVVRSLRDCTHYRTLQLSICSALGSVFRHDMSFGGICSIIADLSLPLPLLFL